MKSELMHGRGVWSTERGYEMFTEAWKRGMDKTITLGHTIWIHPMH